MEEQEGEHPRA